MLISTLWFKILAAITLDMSFMIKGNNWVFNGNVQIQWAKWKYHVY